MTTSLNVSRKEIGQSKSSKKLPRINNSMVNLKSLSQLYNSQDISSIIGNNLNESSNVQTSKNIKNENAFNNFVFQDNFTKKKITYADLKSDAHQRLAQSVNNISRSVNSLNEGGNLHSFHLNNLSSQNASSLNNNPIQSVSKLNISAIHPSKANSQYIDFQREIKNSIQQFGNYAIVLKSSEQQVKNLVKSQLQKHEYEFNSKQPNFNSKRLDYIEAQRDILRIEKNSLHSLLNDSDFKFDPKLHKMNFVTLCQMSPEDRQKIEAYFKDSLKQDPLINSNRQHHDPLKNTYKSYSELVQNDVEKQEENVLPEDEGNKGAKKKKRLMNFNDVFDPFKPKKILKSYIKKKKIFDLFQEETHELTMANKIDLLKDNLKENVLLKLKQQYGIKNSHLIIPPLDYLSFKDLDVDRNIIIYRYLQEIQRQQDIQSNENVTNKDSSSNTNNTPPAAAVANTESSKEHNLLKLPSIYVQSGLNNQDKPSNGNQPISNENGITKNIISEFSNTSKLEFESSKQQSLEDKQQQNQSSQKKAQKLPEGEVLKPFYEMTNYRTDEEIIEQQKEQIESLRVRFKNKKMTEEQELFCRRLEENDLIEIEFLLNRNPDLMHTINKEGDTVMHIASRKCNIKVIKFLLSNGANLHALNSNMKTPIEVCKLIKRTKLENFFENYLEEIQLLKKWKSSSSQFIQDEKKEGNNASSSSEGNKLQKSGNDDKNIQTKKQQDTKKVQFNNSTSGGS